MLEFDTSIGCCEVPVGLGFVGVAVVLHAGREKVPASRDLQTSRLSYRILDDPAFRKLGVGEASPIIG